MLDSRVSMWHGCPLRKGRVLLPKERPMTMEDGEQIGGTSILSWRTCSGMSLLSLAYIPATLTVADPWLGPAHPQYSPRIQHSPSSSVVSSHLQSNSWWYHQTQFSAHPLPMDHRLSSVYPRMTTGCSHFSLATNVTVSLAFGIAGPV
jgi:hypothetical protein